ncbi:hypothetical protein LT493_10195 [Streptomyces tricolor]|nr:hypothetical protein [Streptomyces tricolor]
MTVARVTVAAGGLGREAVLRLAGAVERGPSSWAAGRRPRPALPARTAAAGRERLHRRAGPGRTRPGRRPAGRSPRPRRRGRPRPWPRR